METTENSTVKKQSPYCTLTDLELIASAKDWIQRLINSGGRDWCLPVPANPNKDVDLILSEVVHRFEKISKPCDHLWITKNTNGNAGYYGPCEAICSKCGASPDPVHNFITDCIAGRAVLADINDYIDKWHVSESSISLPYFLGMTEDEYILFVKNESALPGIIETHKLTN